MLKRKLKRPLQALSHSALPSLAIALAASSAGAQVAPDAGQILQQSQPGTLAPQTPSVKLDVEGEPLREAEAGGQRVSLTEVRFEGNSRFSSAELMQVIGDQAREPLDLAGLRRLANKVSRFYRNHGYPFARALLPAQSLDDGVLRIHIVEGRYGRVDASSADMDLAAAARPYLAGLTPGELIESATLERRMLLLGDLPGITVTPIMRPSDDVGRGNLEARVSEAQRITLQTGADNHGSRYSGEYRSRLNVAVRHLLRVGDELSLSALYSNESTWLGDLRYSLPLGASGLRGELGYAHTDYSLGRGFDGYGGTAEVYSAQLSYPLLRRQQANVTLFARYRYKDLDDTVDFADYRKATESHSLPLGIQFDARDSLGKGGLTYGRLAVVPGTLKQSQQQSWIGLSDADYGFTKVNINIVRHQTLDKRFSLYSRIEAQWADRRYLDGSESFSLGGPHGVRAYPISEGLDGRGWLTQLELRHRTGRGLAPYLFYDLGRTPNGGIDGSESRRLAGAGLGLRYQRRGFNLDLASAWEVRGGDALSDDRQRDPRVWAAATIRF